MFGDGYVAWLVCRERNRDLLRQAERYRLVRQALPARHRHGQFHCRALIWLGQRLVDWRRRPTDLRVGRVVGFTADDMVTFIQSGLEGPDVSNQRFIAASRDGWNFDGRYDIQETIRDFGFDILYEGVGEAWDMVDNESTVSI